MVAVSGVSLLVFAAFAATAEADRARRVDGQLGQRLRPPADWQVLIGGNGLGTVQNVALWSADNLNSSIQGCPGNGGMCDSP